MAEVILPGTYITVRDEALISAGRVSTGNIGIVGTANKGQVGKVTILSSFTEAREAFGTADSWTGGNNNELTLMRAMEQIFHNGGRTVYAVRVASSAAANAGFQVRDGSNAALSVLTAKTPGTWGNEISIDIANAAANALFSETLPGNAASLSRTKVVASAGQNIIQLRQLSTGKLLNYTIVYNVAPNNAAAEVRVNTSTGALTFTTLSGFAPVAADTILARYEVPAANSKKVDLYYGPAKESFTVVDSAHLAALVNVRSRMVSAPPADEVNAAFFNVAMENTGGKMRFGTGINGNVAGANGETADHTKYGEGLALLEGDIVNIVTLAGQTASNAQMVTALQGHLNGTAEIKRERIGVIGSDASTDANAIAGHTLNSDRLIFVGPGIKVSDNEVLTGAYTAAAVVGLIASLPVQASPTNKTLTIPGLAANFNQPKLEKLVQNRVMAIENRSGFRIVKGITTATNSAWHQITTRRIVDFATYGVRSGCNPYIGKLNNNRVRGAMKATIDAFLTRMVEAEALVSYELDVTATRAQEIAGEAIVTMTVRPTFSIDFIMVTMYLG
ncbi:MAG TPA: phage tail sheath protein [Bacteroidetes bacterium]|nr:phage tail sheath protein [Bacteroidota bacterium]